MADKRQPPRVGRPIWSDDRPVWSEDLIEIATVQVEFVYDDQDPRDTVARFAVQCGCVGKLTDRESNGYPVAEFTGDWRDVSNLIWRYMTSSIVGEYYDDGQSL